MNSSSIETRFPPPTTSNDSRFNPSSMIGTFLLGTAMVFNPNTIDNQNNYAQKQQIVVPYLDSKITSCIDNRFEIIKNFATKLLSTQKDMPPELDEVFRKSFFEMLSKS